MSTRKFPKPSNLFQLCIFQNKPDYLAGLYPLLISLAHFLILRDKKNVIYLLYECQAKQNYAYERNSTNSP